MSDPQKSTALITGGGRGIGRSLCLELARAGHHVIINYLSRQEDAEKTLERVLAEGGTGEILALDVRDESAWKTAIDELSQR